MFSSRALGPADWLKLHHFGPADFTHPDKMGLEFVEWLDSVRTLAGVPMIVSSDWRSATHNADVGGAADSAHLDTPCNAADFRGPHTPDPADPHWNRARFKIVSAALALGCKRVGVYADGSIHLDRTESTRPAGVLWHVVDNPA